MDRCRFLQVVKWSPVTAYSGGACYVWLSGDVYGSDDVALVDSYGNAPDIRYTSFWRVDISGAPDSYLHNDVSYSYGI